MPDHVKSFTNNDVITSNILKINYCLVDTLNNILKNSVIKKWHA